MTTDAKPVRGDADAENAIPVHGNVEKRKQS
jgi:hypothetical protein